MRMLVIGGTRFVGRHIVQAAIERGHDVTLFHRGQTGLELFPDAEHILGDRHSGGLARLGQRRYDTIIDTTAYQPEDVREASHAASDALYVLVSSASVYRDPVSPGSDEGAPLWSVEPPPPHEMSAAEQYGYLKALCELEARERFEIPPLIARPGLIIGPHDWSARLGSWLGRLQTRRVVLAAEPTQPIQLIDARDLGKWLIAGAEERLSGTFNAVGPSAAITMSDLLAISAQVVGSSAALIWAGDAFISERNVGLPLWLPLDEAGLFSLSSRRALAVGLRLRPLEDSVADVFAWEQAGPVERGPQPLSGDEEDALLRDVEPKQAKRRPAL